MTLRTIRRYNRHLSGFFKNRKEAKAKGSSPRSQRRATFEPLEPRLLLSADLDPVAGILSSAIGQLDGDLDNFFSPSSSAYDLNTPLPLVNMVEGSSFDDAFKNAPTINELLSLTVDYTHDGDKVDGNEATIAAYDSDNDGKVEFTEFFQQFFVDKITAELSDIASGPSGYNPNDFANWLDTNLDFTISTNGLAASDIGYESVSLDVEATYSNTNKVGYDLDFTFTASKELPIDLGRAADEYGLSFPEGVTVDAEVSFGLDFGVLTSGENASLSDDVYLELNDLKASVAANTDLLIDFNLGFLGLETYHKPGDTSNIKLDVEVEADAVDPTAPTELGFSAAQYDYTALGGSITASTAPTTYTLSHDAEFILRVGDSDARTVEVTAGSYGNIATLLGSVNTAIDTAGLGDVVEADNNGGRIRLSVVDQNFNNLGFGSELTLNGSAQTAAGAPTFGTAIDFVVSLDHATPKLISITSTPNTGDLTADVNVIVGKLTTALSSAGISGITVTNDSDKIRFNPGSHHLQVSNNLTFDSKISYSDLTGTSTANLLDFNINKADAEIDLHTKIKSGISGLSGTDLEINFSTTDAFGQVLDSSAPDPKDQQRIYLDPLSDITFTNFDDLLNFKDFSASTVIGQIQQLATWLGGVGDSELFSVIDIPFSEGDLSDVLDLADLVADTLLFDDGDDGIGGSATDTDKLLELVDGALVPNFANAQELATALGASGLNLLDSSIDGTPLHYNSVTNILTYDINISHNLIDIELPIDFNFDLDPLFNVSSTSKVVLDATAGLQITLGLDVSDSSGGILTDSTTLADLGIDMTGVNGEVALTTTNTPRIVYGRLTNDATFDITVGAEIFRVTIDTDDTDNNLTVANLVSDINLALQHATKKVGDDYTGDHNLVSMGFSINTDATNPNRLKISSTTSDFTLSAQTGDPAINELGFKASQEADGSGPYYVTTTKDAPRNVGQLTDNAEMTVTFGGTDYTVTLEAAETDANRTIIDLIKDVDTALSTPSLLSGAVTGNTLAGTANFDISINGSPAVSVAVSASSTDGSAYVEFNGNTDVDITDDTITILSHNFLTGDKVEYINGGGTSIDGLSTGSPYYVIVVDSDTIKLADTADDANANIAVDLLALGVGAAHRLTDAANADFQDLVDDINRAFIGTSLEGLVRAEAYEWNSNDHIKLTAVDDSVVTLELTVSSSDPADTQLHLPTGTTLCANLQDKIEVLSQGDKLVFRAYAEELSFNGATNVDIDTDTITIGNHDFVTGREVTYSAGGGGLIPDLTEGGTYYVIVDSSTTIKLASSEANAFAGTAVDITATGSGADQTITAAGISGFTIAGSGAGYTQLGLSSSQTANINDLRIYLTDDTVNGGLGYYDVSLDGATTIIDIIDKIHQATGGTLNAGHYDAGDVLVEINPDNDTGLRLTDNTFSAPGSASDPLFQVAPVNASPAAILLGILAIDPVGDDNGNGVINAADGDGMITGAPLTGTDLMDRFFIDNFALSADFSLNDQPETFTGVTISGSDNHKVIHSDFELEDVGRYIDITAGTNFITGRYKIISIDVATNTATLDSAAGTPGASGGSAEIKAQASAAFGFVGVSLVGGGSLTGEISTGLSGGTPLTLTELIDGLGDISSIINNPTITNDSGTLTFDLEVEPDFTAIVLGSAPQIQINIGSIGNPFTITEYASPTWVSDNSFSLAGDLTDVFTKGLVIDIELGSPVIPAEILGSSYAAGVTTVTLLNDVLSGGSIAKAFTPVPPTISITELDLGSFLPDFDDLNFDNILEALKKIASFLDDIQGFDLFDQQIPLINKSINDLMGLADSFTKALNDIENDPAATLQLLEDKIENAFGLPADGSGPFGINLSLDGDILKFSLDLGVDFNESIGLEIPDFLSLDDLGIPGLSGSDMLGLTGAADLNASGSLIADFDFGIDLSSLTGNPADADIYIYDTTGVVATLSASGQNLSFKAGVGPIGLTIQNHSDFDSEISINGSFSAGIDAAANTGNKALIGDIEFDGDNFNTAITGTVDGTLPTFFPTESLYVGNITVDGDLEDIPDFQFITDTTTTPLADHIVIDAGDVIEGIKNFDFAKQFNLFDNILLAVDGIDMFFEGVQYVLDTDVLGGLNVPIIGDAFSQGADFIEDFRKDFISPFRDLIEAVEDAADDFADADKNLISKFLSDSLGGLLQATEYDASDAPSIDEFQGYFGDDANKKIALTTNLDDYLDGGSTELKDTYIQWNLAIGDTYTFGTDFGFDIGIPGLGLEADGDITITIGWDIDFGFGISFEDGFYVDISDLNELTVYIDVDLGDSSITGTLGFLELSATVDPVTDLGIALAIDVIEKNATGDDAKKLQFSELGKVGFETGIAASADIDLDMALEFSSSIVGSNASGFPKLGADFLLDWSIGNYNSGDPEASTFVPLSGVSDAMSDGLKLVEFQDITLDLGSFVSDVLGPIVGKVQDYTEPIQPIIEFITTPFPVLSDFGLNITPLDLAAMYGSFDPGLIYAVADIITLINSIPDPDEVGSLELHFGDLTLFDSEATGLVGSIDLMDPNLDPNDAYQFIGDNAANLLSSAFGDNWFSNTLGSLAGEAADIMGDLTKETGETNPWAFPILEDPMQVFGLLMGRPAVLVTYDMAPLEFEFEYSQFFPIYGPLGVSINIEFGANIDFAFGYDTLGIQEFVEGDFRNPLVLFDGFYISDTDLPTGDFGTDVPELVLTGGLWAAAELNLGVARAGVGGGVFIEIDFDLFDPDRDGRVRIKEIVGNIVNEWEYGNPALAPLAIFDVHGEITAELFAFLKIDLFILEIDKRWQLTPPITILEFDIPFTRPPVLATELEGGNLQINAGEFAEQRLNGNLDDFGEHFVVTQGSNANEVKVKAPGLWDDWQTYTLDPGGTIIFKGGEGDDTFEANGVTSAFLFEIDGGIGNDNIILSASPGAPGAAVIYGSEGDDVIYGGSGDDIIYGLKGNDTIYGGGGNDIIFADDGRIGSESIQGFFNPLEDGNDKVYGGGGNDIIFGSGGLDTIYGDDESSVSGDPDNDLIIGDGGKLVYANDSIAKTVANVLEVTGTQRDRLDPQGGNDILIGGAGSDIIYGGTGNDTIDGGAGTDTLYGEEGFDTIYGGSGVDHIYGDAGGDTIYGERDANLPGPYDTQDGGSAAGDFIYGEAGRDTIYGDTGLNDGVEAGGNDEIYGGAGADFIDGDAGNDTIYGEGDPDVIYGGTGKDTIDGGAGGDIIYGDRGPEDLQDTGTPSSPWNPKVYGSNLASDYIFGETYSDDAPGAESSDDFIYIRGGSDFVDGQGGSDTYKISLLGADNSGFINIYDSGGSSTESDYMKIRGTMYDDTFLLRKSTSSSGLAFVALLNEAPYAERINYWSVEGGIGLERMLVSGLFGNDHFASDDVGTDTTIEGNEGEDTFQVGQLYNSPRDICASDYNNIEPEDVFATIETTVGWLSDGINKPMTIYGGVGNDNFTVFHNKAVLSLFGEDGDDTFLIKAFALAGSSEPFRDRTDVSGGAGVDLVQYAMNAPVNIDGGDGFDRVIIIGTEFGDDFVVTKDGVYGAGLNVNFVNIESLAVDGAEGDDRFYVMSTGENFITELFGGLGSDTFNMSGDTPPIISNDLRGHSGVITHEIEATGTNYDETIIAGISANVSDNDTADPVVIISEPDGNTEITEGGPADSYCIVLSKAPVNPITVQVNAPVQTIDQFERKAKMFQLYSPTEVGPPKMDRTTISLVFTAANWFIPQQVFVSAPDDGDALDDEVIVNEIRDEGDYDDNAIEGDQTGFINHVVSTSVGIAGYATAAPTVIQDPYDSTKYTSLFTDSSANFDPLTIGFDLAGYILQITDGPGAGQSLRILEVYDNDTLVLDGKFRECAGSVIGTDSHYKITRDIEANRAITVLVHDNDKAGVVISESDNSTDIFEAGATDTIEVVLGRQPENSSVTVSLASNDGQLSFSDTTLTFSKNDVDLNAWNIPQIVTVTAVDDIIREGFHHGLISFGATGGDSDHLELVTQETITLTEEQAYVGLMNRPAEGPGDTYLVSEVLVDGLARASNLFDVVSNKVVFLNADGDYDTLDIGTIIKVTYQYDWVGYNNLYVKPVLTDIADDEVAQVKITQTGGFTDVIEFTPFEDYDQSQTQNNTVFSPNILSFDFDVSGMQPSAGGTLTISAIADLDLTTEYLSINGEGVVLSDLFVDDGEQQSLVTTVINLSKSQLETLAADGVIHFEITPSSGSGATGVNDLGSSELTLQLTFATEIDEAIGFPKDDTYSVVLTKAPSAAVQILIDPQQTKTSAGKVINWGEQVTVSSTAPGAIDNGDGTITLTFTPGNWSTPQIVTVSAIDDDKYDGDDTQVFAPEPHTVSDIQGPLYLYGEGGNGSIVDFEPTMLHYETDYMKETDDITSVAADGTTITVAKETLINGAQLINDKINDLIVDGASDEDILDAFVSEMLTVTLADGLYTDAITEEEMMIKEVGQFRLIVGYIDNGTTVTLELNEAWDLTKSWNLAGLTEQEYTYNTTYINEYTISHMSPNFFADETEKIDYLFVYNEDSQADNEVESRAGWLTDSSILDENGTTKYLGNSIVESFVISQDGKWLRGLGMAAEDLYLGGVYHPRGITYGDMEVVEINLGDGIDNFTVEDTHVRSDGYQTWTMINSGDEVEVGAGDTITVDLDSDMAELYAGTVTDSSTDTLEDALASFQLTVNGNGSLVGYLVEITGGTGLGQQRVIASHDATTLTFDTAWSVSLDTSSEYRIIGAEKHMGTVSSSDYAAMDALPGDIKDLNVLIGDFSSFADGSLKGYVIEIIDGAGIGTRREIIANSATQLTLSSTWNSDLSAEAGSVSVYRIYGDQDGPIAINAQGGDDKVYASTSSIPLVIFGGDGVDRIEGGSADDIIFGDRGRVEYVDESGKIVTLLGLAREKLDPQYIDNYSYNTLTDDDGSFPVQNIDMQGLEGYMLSTPDGRGFGQRVLITDNNGDTLTVTPDWDMEESVHAVNFDGADTNIVSLADDEIEVGEHAFETGDQVFYTNGGDTSIEGLTDRTTYFVIKVNSTTIKLAASEADALSDNAIDLTALGTGDHHRVLAPIKIIPPGYIPDLDFDSSDPQSNPTKYRISLVPEDQTDGVKRDPSLIIAVDPEVGGDDIIIGNSGNDRIFGGAADDTINGNLGDDIIFGDHGRLDYTPADVGGEEGPALGDFVPATLNRIRTTYDAIGGGDTVYGDEGNDIILGGYNDSGIGGPGKIDTLSGNADNDIILGDNGLLLYAPNMTTPENPRDVYLYSIETLSPDIGGDDFIYGNEADDIIFGGDADDTIDAGHGNNIVLGDNGLIDFVRAETNDGDPGADWNPYDIDLIESNSTTSGGGIDTISTGDGQDIIIGGRFGDTINAHNGDNLVIGDSGRITAANEDSPQFSGLPMTFGLIETIEPDDGGDDNIITLADYDIILGGDENDTIDGGHGNNLVLGDNGKIDYVRAEREAAADGADSDSSDIDLILSTETTFAGGSDNITTGDGQDLIIGGRFGDTINANDGDNLVIGDSGQIEATTSDIVDQFSGHSMTIGLIETIEPGDGGADTINTGDDNDFILGGFDSDIISAGGDDDYVLGDNGEFLYDLLSDDIALLGRPDVGRNIGGTILTLDSSAVIPDPRTLDRVMTTNPTIGDDDVIYGNAGNDVIFGGTGSDQIWGDSDNDNPAAGDGDGNDIIFGDHAKIYPSIDNEVIDEDFLQASFSNPDYNSFFINNNFFSIYTSEADGFNTDGLLNGNDGNDFEDIIFGAGGDDTIIGGQDDDILFGGEDNDILIGGHNVVDGIDELDDMDQALQDAILTGTLADMDASDVNDINDLMDGDGGEDVMAGDNAIIVRQHLKPAEFLLGSQSYRYQELAGSDIYSMVSEMVGGIYAVDVGFASNITGIAQYEPGSDVGYTVILLNHSEDTATNAALNPTDSRVFGNDVMAGGAFNDEMFGQLGDDIMQGDGSIDFQDAQEDVIEYDPSPAVVPSFTIPDNQDESSYFMVQGNRLLFNVVEDNDPSLSDDAYGYTDGDDYLEGNGGNDRMYGNLGQDDMIGGSSILFGLDNDNAEFYGMDEGDYARPDGADMIYGGAGDPDRLSRNDYVGPSDTAPGDDNILEVDRHGRDADVIMGDNANIYRLVGTMDYTDNDADDPAYGYLQFAYDQSEDRGDIRIVPRAVDVLDYWYTYGNNPQPDSLEFHSLTGAGDLIYGESGDDIIHGMAGDDVLFGNSEDDDLYGEAGSDWISGGTGEDGILGDDGLIKTSRNDLDAEPLYNIAALNPDQGPLKNNEEVDINSLNAEISTPGNIQRSIINVEGRLKKTVDLLSFDAGLANGDTLGVNDIIYGGLNDDFIHSGAGDDAISGAEALPTYYDGDTFGFAEVNTLLQTQQQAPANPGEANAENPFWFNFAPYNPGDILRYEGNTLADADDPHSKTKQEFALYDEFNPRRKIMLDANGEAVETAAEAIYDFLLNFNEDEGALGYPYLGDDAAMQTDGDDRIFGDLGNDWIVGGTGRDNMYGGRGDDLLNMDDNHDSGSGGKVGPHDPPADALDNTQSDEYQAYADIAYGGAGRDILILNTGADRSIDWVGEYNSYIVPFSPFGAFHISRTLQPQLPEYLQALSMSDGIDTTVPDGARFVEQKNLDVRIDDPDPLRNGEPYGELGMVRQPDYDWQAQTGAPNDPQPGNLQGQREIMRRELFTDDMALKIFAGDVGTFTISKGKLLATPESVGSESTGIYYLDEVQPGYMEILVTINAAKDKAGWNSNGYIIFDYKSATDFKVAGIDAGLDKIRIGHRTVDGWVFDAQGNMQLRADTDYDLTLVMYGTVATIWINQQESLTFDFGTPLNTGLIGLATDNSITSFDDFQVQKLPPTITFEYPDTFDSETQFTIKSGEWATVDGRFIGTSGSGENAVSTQSLAVAPYSLLELEAGIKTSSLGGLVFDYDSADHFKFAALDAVAGKVIIGHFINGTWKIDAEADFTVVAGQEYTLGVSLFGTTASVTVNGQAVVGFMFNSLLNDGDFGLVVRDGSSSFDNFVVRGDDPAYKTDDPALLLAAESAALNADNGKIVTQTVLEAVFEASIERWADDLDIASAMLHAAINNFTIAVADLDGQKLGQTSDDTILIDSDAAGFGWFIDVTPDDDVEYIHNEADGKMDLLSVVMHEVGHALGLEHTDAGVMASTLDPGTRSAAQADDLLDSKAAVVFDDASGDFMSIELYRAMVEAGIGARIDSSSDTDDDDWVVNI